ncbi:DUF3841 domain-containing protein [Ktedonobacter robiniae]|uniref:DUF3841 domain-containing protein n=1 Tax=Ktedonobacter robiniae TaxID=2778365 RepID=A0ABQ3V4I4_9CHLR|nr:DUF3841 domain-containing protein [Ktedonobacter robiniae]GHO60081.1 hypothetical protein KSB_85560 [Ktedonobacter robiniae]
MIVWTIQSLHVWEMLQRDGILYGPDTKLLQFDDPTEWQIKVAYNWLVQQMEKKIGPRPQPERYPLWAWYQYDGEKRRRPDLRGPYHLQSGTKGVRIEFDIAEDQILLSDIDDWIIALNYGYLCHTEGENEAFYAKHQRSGFIEQLGQYLQEPYHSQMLKSWERIFDLDYASDSNWGSGKTRAEKKIQGTFWQLSLEQVRKVTFFTSRKAGNR